MRPTPRMTLAWRVDAKATKRYSSRGATYYAIAKAMLVRKYPAWLEAETGREPDASWGQELINRRAEKAQRLFSDPKWWNTEPPGYAFDVEQWKRVVRRVAKFLAFVDSRRSPAEQLESINDTELTKAFETAERNAGDWMNEAVRLRAEMARRAGR
jgi:hypothetical protein